MEIPFFALLLIFILQTCKPTHLGCNSYTTIEENFRNIENGITIFSWWKTPSCDRNNPNLENWVRFKLEGIDARIPLNQQTDMMCYTTRPGFVSSQGFSYSELIENIETNIEITYYSSVESQKLITQAVVMKCNVDDHVFFVYKGLKHEELSCSFGVCNEKVVLKWCYSLRETDASVCSGNGICTNTDTCTCKEGYNGEQCQFLGIDTDHEIYNTEAKRLVCSGANTNFLCDDSQQPITSLELKSNLGDLEDKTVRDICANKYWAFAVDSEYHGYIWGNKDGCSYLSSSTTSPSKITFLDISGAIKKVECTASSIFLLTYDDQLFGMGKNEDLELGMQLEPVEEFQLIETNVKDIVASDHNLFIISKEFDGTLKRKIKLSGATLTSRMTKIIDGPKLINSTAFPTYETPRIQTFQEGALLTFSGNNHFYIGKDHPSLFVDTEDPKKIDFSYQSQLKNEDSIEFFTRQSDGCLLAVSENRIFQAGKNCPIEYSFQTPSKYFTEITESMYNDWNKEKRSNSQNDEYEWIVDFKCQDRACFFLTWKKYENVYYTTQRSQNLYFFGTNSYDSNDSNKEIKLGISGLDSVTSFSSKINLSTDVTQHLSFIIPIKGNFFSLLGFKKPTGNWLTTDTQTVNSAPPSIINTPGGFGVTKISRLLNNQLSLVVVKEQVYNQVQNTIQFGTNFSPFCSFPGTISPSESSFWKFKNAAFDVTGASYDYFSLDVPWDTVIEECGWNVAYSNGWMKYTNRLFFSTFFLISYSESSTIIRREDFELNVQINFPLAFTTSVSFDVTRASVSDSFKFVVLEKQFDRSLGTGKLIIQTQTTYPLLLTSIALNTAAGTGGDWQEKFLEAPMIVQDEASIDCKDLTSCYQNFEINYAIKQDVCDPSFEFKLQSLLKCVDSAVTSCPTLNSDDTIEFSVFMLAENLCLTLAENIDLEGEMLVYSDWTKRQLSGSFTQDEYVYIEAKLQTQENVGIDLAGVRIDQIVVSKELEGSVAGVGSDPLFLFKRTDELQSDENSLTTIGSECKLIVDSIVDPLTNTESKDSAGFHFKLVQGLLEQKYGENFNFSIYVVFAVQYDSSSSRRRRGKRRGGIFRRTLPISLTSSELSTGYYKTIKVSPKSENVDAFEFNLPLIIIIVAIVVIGLILLVLLVGGTGFLISRCISCCKTIHSRIKKRRNSKLQENLEMQKISNKKDKEKDKEEEKSFSSDTEVVANNNLKFKENVPKLPSM